MAGGEQHETIVLRFQVGFKFENVLDGAKRRATLCHCQSCWLPVHPTEEAADFFLHAFCDLGHLGRMTAPPTEEVQRAVRLALAEDIGTGDVTTLALVSKSAKARAAMVAHEGIVAAGLAVAEAVFRELTPKVQIERYVEEGAHVELGQALMHVTGIARAVFSGERVALNFVQRMSGIDKLTAEFVEVIRGRGEKFVDTRKASSGLRYFGSSGV